jgi:hypothetical protein
VALQNLSHHIHKPEPAKKQAAERRHRIAHDGVSPG